MADISGQAGKYISSFVKTFDNYFFRQGYWMYIIGFVVIIFIYLTFFVR